MVVRRFSAWSLIDVCGCLATLLEPHLARIITELSQRLSNVEARPKERPIYTWLHAIEADLGPLNFGLATAW